MEELDVVEPTGAVVGRAPRDEVHRAGSWHRVFHCVVVRSGTPARMVLQRRPSSARSFAGLLDLSATGHLIAGEEPVDGRRELLEEIGLDVPAPALVPIGVRLLADDAGEGGRNREVAHVFAVFDDRPLDAFPLDQGDVDGLVEIDVADLLVLLADPAAQVDVRTWDGQGPVTAARCRSVDLVPDAGGYWTVLAVMVERLVRGERPVAL